MATIRRGVAMALVALASLSAWAASPRSARSSERKAEQRIERLDNERQPSGLKGCWRRRMPRWRSNTWSLCAPFARRLGRGLE